HLLCLPETTSRGRGCPGTLLERTHDGYARAPPAGATKPFWLLVDPAQSPMDYLFERVWRGWFRLPHRLHHGVLPGDRGLVPGRRSPPRCGRRLDGRERGAVGDLLGPPRAQGPPADRERDLATVDPRVRLDDGCAVDGPRGPRRGRRGRRLPVVVERNHRGTDDGRATERGVRPVVRPQQRILRRRTRLALLIPVYSGANRTRQPNDSRRGARPHRRTRIRHAGRLLPPPAGLPRNDPDPRGPPEGDGLEAAPQVLGDQRPDRPRRRVLHPPRADVALPEVRAS